MTVLICTPSLELKVPSTGLINLVARSPYAGGCSKDTGLSSREGRTSGKYRNKPDVEGDEEDEEEDEAEGTKKSTCATDQRVLRRT